MRSALRKDQKKAALEPKVGDTWQEFRRGYRLLLTAAIGCGLGVSALGLYSLPYLMPAFRRVFGWDSASVGYAASFITGGLFAVGPLSGWLTGRYGTRLVTLISVPLLTLGFGSLTFIGNSVWTLYIGMAFLPVLGVGTLYVSYSNAVNTWFDKGRGVALGTMTSGTGFTAFLLPLILPPIIESAGWRSGYLTLAILALCELPLAFFFLRDRTVFDRRQESVVYGLPFRQIIRSYRFWFLAAGVLLVAVAMSGAILHFVPMFTDLGGPRRVMERTAALYGLSLLASRFLVGVLLDRFSGRLVSVVLFTVPGLIILTPALFGPRAAPYYALAIGLGVGAETDLIAYLASRYFGLRAFSQTYGWLFAAGSFGFAIGPLLAGWTFRIFGDYVALREIWAALLFSGAILYGLLGRYPPKPALDEARVI